MGRKSALTGQAMSTADLFPEGLQYGGVSPIWNQLSRCEHLVFRFFHECNAPPSAFANEGKYFLGGIRIVRDHQALLLDRWVWSKMLS